MALFTRKARSATEPAANHHAAPGPARGEPRIHAIGIDMLDRARDHKAGLLNAKFYQDKLMDWSMKDHEFKVQLFRFVDAFPAFTTPEMVHEHLVDYLTQPGVKLPPFLATGLRAGGVAKGLMTKTVSGQINSMAHNFIAGTDAADALPRLRKLWKDGISFSVDLLGEACVSGAEADMYQAKYLDLVENLVGEASTWAGQARLEKDHLGVVPRVNVSIKVSSLCAQFDPIDPESSIAELLGRLEPILIAAKRNGVLINFDMEQYELKDLTLHAFCRACEKYDFDAGLAMQAYLKSGVSDARRIADWARRTGREVTVRLVKGAYWDYETIHAEQEGWPCPVWNEKWQTDKCFEEMTAVLLDACPTSEGQGGTKLALGSHNVRSIAAALAGLEDRGLPREAIELQMLHGMADQLKHAAEEMGLRVREYVPVGDMIPGMAYLVRRLLENTSNESWLKAGFLDDASPDLLLAAPAPKDGAVPIPDLFQDAPERHNLSPAVEGVGDSRPFYTEPLRDFADSHHRARFATEIDAATMPTVSNDRTPEQGLGMVRAAHDAFPAWRDTDPMVRADMLVRVAAKLRQRRDELAGIMIKESRKPWREADADVCEAIDFCEYYARLAPPLFERRRLGRFIGELDEMWYQPRGVAVVISPWNFPLAICCGMVTAALVTGNTVVCKPAEQSPGIASSLVDRIWEALAEVGASREVLQFCPAPGETTGAALVRDPHVALLAFTGSKAVGLDIIQAAAVTPEDQEHVKRVICEMGGKNALIVDSSADLDEAVLGVRQSAFGFAGQKCSACSRCIVVDPLGPKGPAITLFTERLAQATMSLVLGDPINPGTDVAPVIDEQAAASIRRYIMTARGEDLVEVCGERDFPDYERLQAELPALVAPTIFAGVTTEHTIYQKEIFGPVLAVCHAHSFDEAMAMANGHQYKLTGGVFTRKPSHIERAKREFRVGNLYINRTITGALVGRQPFGGFGMSGVGSKAGGPDYLMQFVEPRACAENTMRRGFAPEL
ncbi:MAG: RHH-type proline utilization regulon transcriptional repressor/proline dehydrogenase [Phycisphaerales bacterium]|jgi:RHH-type proline utilization regulon transcriptional repressor/proline dehydrogenase/delta 1-pyrroline-5-carboxylate dehydrogenase